MVSRKSDVRRTGPPILNPHTSLFPTAFDLTAWIKVGRPSLWCSQRPPGGIDEVNIGTTVGFLHGRLGKGPGRGVTVVVSINVVFFYMQMSVHGFEFG